METINTCVGWKCSECKETIDVTITPVVLSISDNIRGVDWMCRNTKCKNQGYLDEVHSA